jgi:hypothetical protein
MDTNRDASKNIDWLRVFENLDVDQDLVIEVYETTNDTQKHDYYNKASFKLTLQFLLQFKKRTQFHSIERKLQYIESLNIKPPKQSLTESPLFEQTTFNAKMNFYEFTKAYTKKIRTAIGGQNKTSYVWQSNPDEELPELYRLLLNEYKLIARETTYEQFKAVFTGQPIESINPIKWHQDNASEVLYFITRLEQTVNIMHNPKRADYLRLEKCFVKPDEKPFNVKWKSLKTDLEINLSKDKQNAIDELVENFT